MPGEDSSVEHDTRSECDSESHILYPGIRVIDGGEVVIVPMSSNTVGGSSYVLLPGSHARPMRSAFSVIPSHLHYGAACCLIDSQGTIDDGQEMNVMMEGAT